MRTRLVLSALLLVASHAPLAAQAVRGEVVEEGSGRPVAGTLVVLLDAQGVQRGAVLTDPRGSFFLQAPGAGRYTLRTERVGWASTTSPAFQLAPGEERPLRLAAAQQPLALEGIVVQARKRRCTPRPQDGPETARLWEEARKALSSTAWAQSQRMFRFEVVRYVRDLEPGTLRVLHEPPPQRGTVSQNPFQSYPADSLARYGFVQERRDGTYYHAPDAGVLLSDPFLNDHCFHVEVNDKDPGLVGLSFEPVRGRRLPEVKGTLWLDRRTAELRYLEYGYANVPVTSREVGGRVEFERLPTGAWIVRRWWIRMPSVQEVSVKGRTVDGASMPGQKMTWERLTGLREEGGEVTATLTREGRPVVVVPRAALAGMVFDSTASGPLEGATVFLSGTAHAATTDATGRFEIADVPEGSYSVSFTHPRLVSLGVPMEGRPVAVRPGESPPPLELAVPSPERLALALCPEPERKHGPGVLVGLVIDSATASPVRDARVTASWKEIGRRGGALAQTAMRVETITDAQGYYRVCGVPVGRDLTVVAQSGAKRGTVRELRVAANAPLARDVALGSGAVMAGRVPATQPAAGALAGFHERARRGGGGIFITRADIERQNPGHLADLFRRMPGVEVVQGPTGYRLAMAGSRRLTGISGEGTQEIPGDGGKDARPATGGSGSTGSAAAGAGAGSPDAEALRATRRSGENCPVQYFVDGVSAGSGDGEVLLTMNPAEVEAVEVYRRTSEVPAQFAVRSSACGVVVVWTRRPQA